MRLSRTTVVILAGLIVAAAIITSLLVNRRDTTPLSVPSSALSAWTVVTSDGTDPWLVGAHPPETLTGPLFNAASRRAGRPLVPPAHQALPLVLQSEYQDSLQGVYGTDAVVRIAREAGIESATFHPVCLARQTVDGPSGAIEVYFVPFDAPVFNQLRGDLTPLEPEHAGVGVYDPATLTPALVVGATARDFDRVWPIRFEPQRDCEAEIRIDAPPSPTRH
jgi:hypothetical protein